MQLQSLPIELLQAIWLYLPDDLEKFKMLSKEWSSFFEHPVMYRFLLSMKITIPVRYKEFVTRKDLLLLPCSVVNTISQPKQVYMDLCRISIDGTFNIIQNSLLGID
jgi:hypothetical protein